MQRGLRRLRTRRAFGWHRGRGGLVRLAPSAKLGALPGLSHALTFPRRTSAVRITELSTSRGFDGQQEALGHAACGSAWAPGPQFPFRSGRVLQDTHHPPVCPGPFPQPEPGLQFILPVLHRNTDWLCCVLQVLILLCFTGFNLMTRNPKQIKFALKTQRDQ